MAMPDDELLELLRGILTDIYEKVGATDWTKERQQRIVKAQIVELLRRFDVAVDELVPQMITEEYFKGVESAGAALVKEGVLSSSAAAIDASGRITKEFRKPIYLDSLQTILEDTFLDLKAAIRTAELSSITTIDSTIKKVKSEIAKGTITGNSRKVMQANVAKAFREDGMTAFITKDGKSLPLDFYAMTVTRTKTRTAGVEAASKRYEDNGQDLVQIIEASDSCDICSRYKDMVFSLNGNTPGFPVAGPNDLPPYHPSCYGTTTVFVLSRKQQSEIEAVKRRNDQFDPNTDRRTKKQKEEYEKTQRKRRQANEEKKMFMRYNATLGADNFKSLGAFRKAKRENSPRFQELQSQYRSLMQSKG